MKPTTDQGAVLDALFEVEQDDAGFSILMESRGGSSKGNPATNPDYNPALELLLSRLAALGASIEACLVESTKIAAWPEAARLVTIDDHPYPVHLSGLINILPFRQRIGRGQGRVGREPGATGGGNPTKRIRLRLSFPEPQDLHGLRHYLMNGRVPDQWALLANPDSYDIEGAVAEGGSDTWTLPQGNPKPGDRGLIWMAKGSGSRRGVVTFFVVTAAPSEIKEPRRSRDRWISTPPPEIARRILMHYVRPPGLPLWLDQHPDLLGALTVSRAQGNKLYTVEPEQWAAIVEAAGGWIDVPPEVPPEVPPGGGGQGRLQDPLERKAIELHAMACAREHFMSEGWPEPTDTSAGCPYDWLFVRDDGIQLRVEVKGTKGGPAHVTVTIGEVKSARAAATALFVQHGIVVEKSETGKFSAAKGESLIRQPWQPEDADLEPLTFRHFIL